jgi:hypothetical protein
MYQRAVLELVLEVHPAQLTETELIREATTDAQSFTRDDRIERAIRDLVRTGLLHRSRDFILPSRPALYVNELWGVIF